MAYTYEQLRLAYAAVHGGIEPTSEVASQLMQLTADATVTDAQRMSYILNSADDSTSVAVLTYQFFTGKSPTAVGVSYLVNSTTNAADLSDAYYAPLNLENRFMNFAGNLALVGEAKDAFASQYGAMSFASYVASIYDTIIGNAQARAVGLDPAAIILDIIARRDLLLTSARSAGMISDTSTQAEIDLALKAATAAYLLAEGIKADVGIYAASTNNFMLGLAKGDTVYNTDITETYKPTVTSGSSGKGVAVDNPPDPVTLPGGPSDPNPPTQEPEPSSRTFTLTGGADTFTGETLGDTFSATHLTFNATDALDGGAGADSLTITATTGATYALPAASVTSIETATISNNAGLAGDVSAWTGLNQVNTTSAGEYDLKLAGSTSLTATVTALGANTFAIDGGKTLDVTITGATTAALSIGAITAATGAINISRETTGAVAAGRIDVTGGTSVTVIQKAANTAGTTQTNGVVTVNGSADTTSVTVKADKAATANGSTAGITAARVTINDVNTGSTTQAGTITKASVDGYSAFTFKGTGLTDLSLAHGSGDILINNGGLSAPTNKTLDLTLNGLTGGEMEDAGVYTTLNVTTGSEASTLSYLSLRGLTTLNIEGDSRLTLGGNRASSLETVTISGAAGLTATLTNATLTKIDASATTGANTLTIDADKASFAGGSGVDTITLSATTVSKAIDLGAADDVLTLADGTTTPTSAISGGTGTDTLVMNATDAETLSQSTAFASQVTGFERLTLTALGSQSIDVARLGNYSSVTASGGAGLTLTNFASSGTLDLTGAGAAYTVSNSAFTAGANDVLNVKLSSGTGAAVAFASTGITATGVETINLTNTDTQGTPSGAFQNTATLLGNDLKTLTVSGNAGLALTAASTALTSLDASGITLGGFSWTSGILTGAATIKGSATGTNTVTFSAATGGAVTYVGGAGNDTITGANGRDNVVSLGGGTNSYTGGSGSETITVGNGANSIDIGTGSDTVTITGANASSASVFTTVTGFGAGDRLGLSAQGGAGAATTLGAEITGQTTLAAYLDAAAAGDGHGAAQMKWFRFGGDTYVVLDSGAGSTFTAGTDIVAKLAGNVDLTNATVSNGTLVYAAPPASSLSFVLTTGVDDFTGGSLNDTFTGTHLTLNATDTLDGGAGADSLTITATTGATYALPAASVANIETATISNDSGLAGDVRTWTGLTQLNTNTSGHYELKLAGSTSLTATIAAQGSNGFAIDGGKTLDVTITGATTPNLDIGATTAATGAVKISRETTGAVTAGQINITGGTTVTVTQTATNAVNSTQTNGAVTVNGTASTTEITVKAAKAVTADGSTAGITANTVAINDVNMGSTALAGTITKASVDGYSTLVFKGTALTDLSLAHGAGDITIDNSGLSTPTNKTLSLGLNGVTGGVLDDADIYTTLNVTTGAEASTLADITLGALAMLNLDGTSQLKLTGTPSLAVLTTVKISGAAGLNANLTTPSLLTSIDASGTSGANTLTINGGRTAFTGGSGVDTITLTGTTITKAIDLGAGDDFLTLSSGASATINGGAGTDTLVTDAATARNLLSAGQVTGFERLYLTQLNANTVDVSGLDFSRVTLGAVQSGRFTLSGLASGNTVELTSAASQYVFSDTAFATGVDDVLNLVLTHQSQAINFASAGMSIDAGLETLNIQVNDTGAAPDGSAISSLRVNNTGMKTIAVTGNGSLSLTSTTTSLTNVDASGVTLGGFTWTSGALTGAATIKGSATGTNTVTFSAATGGAITYVGGTGNDVITGANGRDNVVSLGGGTNSYTGGSGSETITAGNGANTINVGTGSDTVNVTAANASSASVFTTVTNFGTGDKLSISAQGGAAAATSLGAKLTGQTTLAAYLDAATAGDGHGTARMNWFQFGGDTYVVLDSGAGATFTAGTDIVTKLTGLVDLSGSSVTNGTLIYGAPPPASQSFVLTTGVDILTGGAPGDTFTGTDLTFNATDTLDGGAGADTLTVTATTGSTYAIPAASVTGIETFTLSNDAGLVGDLRGWTGLTQLNTTSSADLDLKLADSTGLTATVNAQGAGALAIDGGKALDLTITGATTATLNIGATTAATDAVKVSRETTGAVTAGQITVNGGTTVSITQTATNATGTTQTNGAVTVNGAADTNSVTVKAAKAATANGSTAGVAVSAVVINDINKGSTTLAGTITKASVDGYSSLVFKGTALTDLTVAHGVGLTSIDNSGLTTPTNKTLNLTMNGLTGVLDDTDIYTTLNVTTGAEASALVTITFGALATLNLDGASQLKLNSTSSLAALTTVKISGAASLNANLTTPSLLTSIDASETSGANTLTINGGRTAFTGGSGVDTITLSGTTISNTIDLGAGDDVLTLASGTTALSAPLKGGAGTDTLVMVAADAVTASQSTAFGSQLSGFERLEIPFLTSATIDAGALGFSYIILDGVQGTFTLNNFASGGTLELPDPGRVRNTYNINSPDYATGANDVLNLVLNSLNGNSEFAFTGFNVAAGVETINIRVNDISSSPNASSLPSLRLGASSGLKSIFITGNSGFKLATSPVDLTLVDASGITLGGFTWTSGALINAATIKGAPTGANTVIFSAATSGAITYVGGADNDTITGANGRDNVIDLGGGTNSYTGGTGSETITVGNGANTINVGTGAGLDTVNVTAANAASATVFTSVTNFGNGDKLNISAQGGAAAATTLGAEVTGQSTLAAYLDAAAAGDGHGTALMNWFRFGGDTYVVLDSGAGSAFTAGTDIVVKLVGAVDLQVSHVSGGALTYTLPI